MLLIPPSLALIFRHKFKRACGLNLGMFLACTHCVAIPSAVSPTLLISAVETIQTIRHVRTVSIFSCSMYKKMKALGSHLKIH